MKEIIFVITQGSKIKRKDNQIVVFSGEEKIGAFPINRIKNVFIFGNIEISMPAVNFLLSKDVDIYLLSATGKFKGIISNTKLKSNYNLRLNQYQVFIDTQKNLNTAKFFVLNKLQQIEKYTGTDLSYLKNSILNAKRYNEVLGIEGTASAFFFNELKNQIENKNLRFEKREYRPAKDPVNAVLSFVYSLFYGFLFSFLQAKGFDPYIGYLHKKRGTHAVLVSDFMELFRVELTKFAVVVFNKKFLTEEDFKNSSNGVYLKEESLKKFLELFKTNFIEGNKYISLMEKSVQIFIEFLEKEVKK
jgi:CRISPR-associated protein Cas1